MLKYRSIKKEGLAEILVERSRFIAKARPVESKEEALDFFDEIKREHRTATHNVPAFVIGEKSHLLWASDDGEPQGTSGPPILQMLQKEGLTNIAVIVTRYFGGIKLGTGGLVRAYTAAAKAAVEDGGICEAHQMTAGKFKLDYSYLGILQNLEREGEFSILSIDYQDKIIIEIMTEPEKTEELIAEISNISGGQYEEISRDIKLIRI